MITQTQTDTQTERESATCGLNNNSFIPMLNECERFVSYLNKRFSLGLTNNYVITINKATKSASGYFMPKESSEHYTNTTQDLNNINLNTLYLKESNPYEVLTHEVAHFLSHIAGIKDCSSNQYHNKHFKKRAEQLLLNVEKTKHGYSNTTESEGFTQLLTDFKTNKEVFNIIQNQKENKPKQSRLRLYICSCGIKVRVASDSFNALCLDCNTEFSKESAEDD